MSPRLAARIAAAAIVATTLGSVAPPAGGVPRVSPPPASVAVALTAATHSASRCGNTSGRVLLSFDDWAYGDPYRATRVGAYLKSISIRAAFFLINEDASRYPDIVSTLRRQGHWVLDHTWSHPDLTTLSSSRAAWEISHGVTSNRLRPPYGAYSARISTIASSLGSRICTWTIDTRDWETVNGVRRTVSSIRSKIRTAPWSAKASGVILGHLFTDYPAAVPGIVSDLHRQGLLFCRNRGAVGRSMPFPLACT